MVIYLNYNCFERGFDDRFRRANRLVLEIRIMNPVDYIREVERT